MKVLSEKDFNLWVMHQKRANFLTYQDFLNAMAKAPRFCNATLSGPVAKIGVEAMCKKELAAFAATFCSRYNSYDEELLTKGKVPFMMQCFANYKITGGCDLPEKA